MYLASFPLHVIHEQVLTKRVRRGEIGFASTHLRDLLHKVNQAIVTRKHKCIDENASAFALVDFFQRLPNDKRIQPERILVYAAVFQRERRWLAVGDHDDLTHVFFLTQQYSLSET